MKSVETSKMSSKGQVVIPETIRKEPGLEAGSRFVVVGDGDVVILKRLSAPDLTHLDSLLSEARSAARKAGLTRSDISAAIADARAQS